MLFLAFREAVVPLSNDPIMLERSIRSFRHLECKNPSIISDSIGIPRWLQENAKKVSRSRRNLIHIEADKFTLNIISYLNIFEVLK